MTTFNELKQVMNENIAKATEVLKKEFSGLRTGRASTNLLDSVRVDAYGSTVPIIQVGNVTVPEPRMLLVAVWDKNLLKNVEKAIRDSGLGLNPMNDGQSIRIPLPPLSEERRVELTKIAGKYTETGRISVRAARREILDAIAQLKKQGEISEDDEKAYEKEVQAIVDKAIEDMDNLLKAKEAEIKQV
ncbi:MAG: ribosome recycling factor [Alphaproteobacteria bacterium]|nr:ribosome recycling factor [Alphaproteobacteria bacterium]